MILNSIIYARSISIIMVLLFHFFPQIFSLGYLGVDFFFIISGFAIFFGQRSKIKNQKFSPINFFKKRYFRLQPPAIVIILISMIISVFLLVPFSAETTFYTGLAATFGLANFWLIRISNDYFAPLSDLNPFLHFWSLGVEEQFYIFFILLGYFCNFFKLSLKIFLVFIFCFALGGLLLTEILELNKFFNSLSRVWQFFIGISLAEIILTKNHSSKRFLFIGVLFLFLTNYFFSQNILINLIIIMFSIVFFLNIVFEIKNFSKIEYFKNTYFSSLLKYFGNRGYSFYLTHWPIIVFIGNDSIFEILLSLILTFISTELLYQKFEKSYAK